MPLERQRRQDHHTPPPLPQPNNTNNPSVRDLPGYDYTEPPTHEDREVAQALAVLNAYGYGIAMRCLDCGHPIYTKVSLHRMRGRRCAERHDKAVGS